MNFGEDTTKTHKMYLLLCNKLLQNLVLAVSEFCMVSVGQEFGRELAGQPPTGLQSDIGRCSHREACWGWRTRWRGDSLDGHWQEVAAPSHPDLPTGWLTCPDHLMADAPQGRG